MFLPAPRLDDRRWTELVEDALAQIPFHAPEWTDHNASDPGVTFAELLAWLAEMQVFQVDQVPPRHRRKFLALCGLLPDPPRAATTVVQFAVPAGSAPVALPAALECETPTGVRFTTRHGLRVVDARIATLTSRTAKGSADLTDGWRRGAPIAPFGEDPHLGDAFELGLTAALPRGVPVSLAIRVAPVEPAPTVPHHSARIAWEMGTAAAGWRRLDAYDDTGALTSDGRVVVVAPAGAAPALRAVLAGGTYDAPPALLGAALNGVVADQSAPAGALTWAIASGAAVSGAPRVGRRARLGVRRDAAGVVTRLDAGAPDAPAFLVLDYRPPGPAGDGSITIEACDLGRGDGGPEQRAVLPEAAVEPGTLRLWTLEGTGAATTWRAWAIRPDLDASGPADAHAELDASAAALTFGDGAHGLAPPAGASLVAVYSATRGAAGNLARAAIDGLADTAHNRALLARRAPVTPPSAGNSVAARGGADSETLAQLEGRAGVEATRVTRAVTLADYEELARQTPGVRLARAIARANLHPGFPCVRAVGVVTLVVIPYLPPDRPSPSRATRAAVARWIDARRIVGTRVEITGPEYVCVSVRARVRPVPTADIHALPARVAAALDEFLHPLRGGPAGGGWPLGRDVVRSELLQVVDGVAGVDHVLELELVGPGGATCGDVCLGPLELVAACRHQVEVTRR